jgi:NAD+ synthase (glutamine-hydrolysing)
MRIVRVAAVELNQTPLDWEGNLTRIRKGLQAARAADATIVCFPELSITGYGCEDAFLAQGTLNNAWRSLQELLPDTQGLIATFGLPLLFNSGIFNVAAVVVDGVLRGLVAKQSLSGDGVYYEQRWFKPWQVGAQSQLKRDGKSYPLGDLICEVDGIRFGFEICEDAWVADRPGQAMASAGVDIILNPSASNFAFGKHAIRERFVSEGSRAFGVAYVYSNLLGCEAGRLIFDGDCLIASGGKLIARSPRFRFHDCAILTAEVDIDANRLSRAKLVSFRPDVHPQQDVVVIPDYKIPPTNPTTLGTLAPTPPDEVLRYEEFARALALGLFDYMRKSHQKGFVVSLSGGADSSAVSCLVALMCRLALQDLGVDELRARLAYMKNDLKSVSDDRSLLRTLLTCVYQRTRNNSPVTRSAAKNLADALGAQFLEFEIDALIEGYVGMVGKALGESFSWERDDLALQNIQARVRSPGVWLVANKKEALLLTTSNRSEAAVGYATMDGDTSGGLNPIGGIDKHFLRQWLRWMETKGPADFGAVPALAAVNAQQPTAELRPLETHQTDEGDLMPYEVLTAIEEHSIGQRLSPVDVFLQLRGIFGPRFGEEKLAGWIERFFKLWCASQWKRERYAPAFHVDDKNLDPRSWCRFPILSGGYARELEELRQFLKEKQR